MVTSLSTQVRAGSRWALPRISSCCDMQAGGVDIIMIMFLFIQSDSSLSATSAV